MERKFRPYFFLVIFIIVIGLNLYVLSPLFHTFLFSTIIASVFFPLFHYLERNKKFSRKISALICTLAILLTVVIPTIFLITQLTKESLAIYQNLRTELSREVIKEQFVGDGHVAKLVEQGLEFLDSKMTKEEVYALGIEKTQGYLGTVVKTLNSFVADILYFFFHFFLMLLISYALFLTGDRMKEFFFMLSPLPTDQEEKILRNYNQMNYVTLVGNGIGGVAQGVLAGIAFWIAGVPSVFLWTFVMIVLAFIPIIGMSIIFIPTSLYLLITGKVFAGISVFIWCMLVSLIVENVFKPKFVGERLQVNEILLLFYIIAGMSVFGALGLFYGPILCIVFLTVSEIFINYYLKSSDLK